MERERSRKRISRLDKVARNLRAQDPDILEIVQFGSSVYAPRLARDLDELVITRAKKESEVYWRAVESSSRDVDILVKEPGERLPPHLALALLAFGKTLYGTGRVRKEAKSMPIPTFAEARKLLTMADEQMAPVPKERNPRFRDARYRAAFDFLFDAARDAAMTYLATDESRWGRLREKLPKPFNTEFRNFISTLHVQYAYEENFPRNQANEKFREWRDRVQVFIEALAVRSNQ